MTITSDNLIDDVKTILINSVREDKALFTFMLGYLETVDWSSKSPEQILEDHNYKSTCEGFIDVLTTHASIDYKRDNVIRQILDENFIALYDFFNRPKEWSSHNPISNEKLDSFTMKYIGCSAYQNDELTISIIKAYIASSIFDETFILLSEGSSYFSRFLIFITSTSRSKFLIFKSLTKNLKWGLRFVTAPCLSMLLYFRGYETFAQAIGIIFCAYLLKKITGIFDYGFHRHKKLSKIEKSVANIDDGLYILRVLSKTEIHVQSLRALIDSRAKNAKAAWPAPLMILLDHVKEKSSFIKRREITY